MIVALQVSVPPVRTGVPVESVLVELDDCLGDLHICFFCRDQICFIRAFPLDEEEQLPGLVGGSYDLLWLETSGEPSQVLLGLSASCQGCQ